MFSSDNNHKDLFEAIWRMACMAEYREGNHQSHLERIRSYTSALAQGLGLSRKEVQIISVASPLHDIGKAGLPEHLVLKLRNEPYTAANVNAAKVHTWLGSEMLKNSQSVYLQTGECIALNHHERWDGSGYPNGLRGDAIPLGARIVGLADVFDALTTPRPYKMAVSPEEARRMIQDNAGLLFDPKLVDVFNDKFDEILHIHRSKK
ncbi:MAG TPA: HD domain-containing phosphohydrolase [Anaerolineales bacterium]|nr:HD domain-containing phosphohydrolase [Anaerolineales bacterium]